jgi:hypothetical protein
MGDITCSNDGFSGHSFLALAQRVWPHRPYDVEATSAALTHPINIGARDGRRLVGTVRVLTDGYFLATVPEILVDRTIKDTASVAN